MPSSLLSIDVVIPVYNAERTLRTAVDSVLAQAPLNVLWLVDDGSTDGSWALMQALAQQHPHQVKALRMPANAGVAAARNWGLKHSHADLVAFLDADDSYLPEALAVAQMAMQSAPSMGLVRLGLQPQGFSDAIMQHPQFAHAWRVLQMTVGGNTVFRRGLLLACGGFPEDALFKKWGGEDGALGIALTHAAVVGTVFEKPFVVHNYHEGVHAMRLLNAHLGLAQDMQVTQEDMAAAEAVTQRVVRQLGAVLQALAVEQTGICELHLQYGATGGAHGN